MGATSSLELLALHGVRVLGGPTLAQVAGLFSLPVPAVREALLDAEAYGWASRYHFFGSTTWSLTERGRVEDERLLAAELDAAGVREVVAGVHAAFLPLNRRHGATCTRWQLRPTASDPLAANDHLDRRWDATVLRDLTGIARALEPLCVELGGALERFGVHWPRYRLALDHLLAGEAAWLDAPDRASCHLVWIGLHEDLLATLGIPRGADG